MAQKDSGDLEALLREFPSLARLDDGRVRCALTGHVMAPRPEAVQPYVRGKKYAAALAKDKHMESLKEFEPHIVRSKYHPDKLFCRITGRLVQAKESSVVQHSTGKRFERGIELLTGGEGKLLDERPPEEVLAEKERSEEARKVALEAKRRAAAEAAAAKEKRRAKKVPDGDDEPEEKLDPKVAAERERVRVNGGFSKEMGCWVPPAHVIESESESEESEESEESRVRVRVRVRGGLGLGRRRPGTGGEDAQLRQDHATRQALGKEEPRRAGRRAGGEAEGRGHRGLERTRPWRARRREGVAQGGDVGGR